MDSLNQYQISSLVKEWKLAKDLKSKHSLLGRINNHLNIYLPLAVEYMWVIHGLKVLIMSTSFCDYPSLFLHYWSPQVIEKEPNFVSDMAINWWKKQATFAKMFWRMDAIAFVWTE